MTYLITFSCYGAHLHGDERGSIDPHHNAIATPARPVEPGLERFEREEMREPPYFLDERQRATVLRAIVDVCDYRGWTLLAAHVRENHVHIVVEGDSEADAMMGDFKRYSSRALNVTGSDGERRWRWTRHGSTRKLCEQESRDRAVSYVLEKQGTAMAVYAASDQRAP